MADACVERGFKGKAQEKTQKRSAKWITCSVLALWITMELYEVPFIKDISTHDFSDQGALLYNTAMEDFQLATGIIRKNTPTVLVLFAKRFSFCP